MKWFIENNNNEVTVNSVCLVTTHNGRLSAMDTCISLVCCIQPLYIYITKQLCLFICLFSHISVSFTCMELKLCRRAWGLMELVRTFKQF